ncbi:MAG TPA: hypothetical protein VMH77_05475 [Steroidobacteraceae bacterium]|nr:hypothetical protein [Steroidobacteraceae bacterium]
MKKVACLVALTAVLPVSAWAACTYPPKPAKAPSGTRATHAEMLAAMKVQNQYQADVNGYLKCLKEQYDADVAKIDPSKSDKDKDKEKKKITDLWETKNDSAVDQAQQVADAFNEQLRICKARPDGCK